MKKQFLCLVLVLAMLLPIQVFAAGVSETNVGTISVSSGYTPSGVVTMEKTISKDYTSLSLVPNYVFYEEYTSLTWYSGNLYLVNIVPSGSRYIATFSGTLSGRTS
ncbi:MAG: hypothetical protein ACYDG2_01350 [Ruminiclostridium sp.]